MVRSRLDARSCAGTKLCNPQLPCLRARKHHGRPRMHIYRLRNAETFHVGQVHRATQPHVKAETDVQNTIVADERRTAELDLSQDSETISEATVSGRGCEGDMYVALLRTDSSGWKNSSATSFNVGVATLFRRSGRDSHHILIVFLSTALLCSSWEWNVVAANASDTSVGLLGPIFVGVQPWDAFWFLLKYPVRFAYVLPSVPSLRLQCTF